MTGDKGIGKFRDGRDGRDVLIGAQQPGAFRVLREGAKDGFGAGMNRAVGFNELDGGGKPFRRDFRELTDDIGVLRRLVIHGVAGDLLPTTDPKAAKVAIAVEDQQWFRRRRGDVEVAFHIRTLNQG